MGSAIIRTAYILQIHNNPEQVNKFISQLISENQADVYIHIDKENYEKISGKIIKDPNVKVLKQCVNCEWGDISQVDATLLLLKEVIASGKNYDFVCLRSGQDLLVRNGFKQYLSKHENSAFMTYRKLSKSETGLMKIRWPKFTRKRYPNIHPIRIFRRLLLALYGKGLNLLPNRNYFPDGYVIYKGSQWFTLPLPVVKYIVHFLDEHKWYYEFFKDTLVPDESFFQTLIMNSPYKNDVVNQNHFYLKWGETLNERNSPQFLRKEDISKIEESNRFFARKFDVNVDSEVVEYFLNGISFEGEKLNKPVKETI